STRPTGGAAGTRRATGQSARTRKTGARNNAPNAQPTNGTGGSSQTSGRGVGTAPNGRPIGSPGSGKGSPEDPFSSIMPINPPADQMTDTRRSPTDGERPARSKLHHRQAGLPPSRSSQIEHVVRWHALGVNPHWRSFTVAGRVIKDSDCVGWRPLDDEAWRVV